MKLTIEIKDSKTAKSLYNFLTNLGIAKVEKDDEEKDLKIPDWHIAIVQQRMADYKKNPKNVLDFDSAIDEIEKDL